MYTHRARKIILKELNETVLMVVYNGGQRT